MEDCVNEWYTAKLMRLVSPIPQPDPLKVKIVDEFALAEYFANDSFVHPETGTEQKFMSVGTIRQQLKKVEDPVDLQCIEVNESVLIANREQRPNAGEAFQHPWLTVEEEGDSDWSVDKNYRRSDRGTGALGRIP